MTAIVAEGVSKRFRLSQSRSSIKDRMFRRSTGAHQDFWALQEMDLTVNEGETVGILGHNGSGKSTLLKCIAGILKPTTGSVRVRGRVASLLELGAGFHPDLTGRENVFINAAFLGIPRREIAQRFDAIVEFAELAPFIDQQVKYYSSGMFVRLGFAVAINVEPDVLLVDEVLAVGDEAFQQKCLERVEEIQREGRTILFVTHGADQVRRICNRGVVLDHGRMVANTEPAEAIRVFREHLHGTMHGLTAADQSRETGAVQIGAVEFSYPANPGANAAESGTPVVMRTTLTSLEPVEESVLDIEIRNTRGDVLFRTNSEMLGHRLPRLTGEHRITIEFPSMPLLDGTYPISLQLRHHHDSKVLALRENQDAFSVMHHGRDEGLVLLHPTLSVS